jgi:hypothetical protein
LLGVTAFWERTEYQGRGSAHRHSLYWHPAAPPDEFIDVINNFAVSLVTEETIAESLARLDGDLVPCEIGDHDEESDSEGGRGDGDEEDGDQSGSDDDLTAAVSYPTKEMVSTALCCAINCLETIM